MKNPWTTTQLRRAHRLRARGCPPHDMAVRLGRTERSIASALSKYGPNGERRDTRPRMSTKTLVTELERRGYTCTPPELPDARMDL